jgi:2'-5' RNA ligase
VASVPTIGVSIAVPEPWGSQLQQYRIGVGDEVARHIPTHVTLLPPHQVADDELEGIVSHLGVVAGTTLPFRVHLRGTGTFQPVSPVVFVNVVEGISQLEELAAQVRRGPVVVEPSFPYHPHVTVAHHLPPDLLRRAFDELDDYDAAFDVDRMWMYLHDEESGWRPSHAFALGGPDLTATA